MFDRQKLIGILKQHEAVKPDVYLDEFGYHTVGVGFNLDESPGTPSPLAQQACTQCGVPFQSVYSGQLALTSDQIDQLLGVSIDACIPNLNSIFPDFDQIADDRQIVLIDMMFNLGKPRFLGFQGMIAAVKAADWAGAATQMLNSKWASQVGPRAKQDAQAMQTGIYQ
jgi:lysozyme